MLIDYQKPALTFEDQLELLIERGLIVSDADLALQKLKTISYYRLSAYYYPFRQNNSGEKSDQFIPEATFENVLALYEFDRNLRLIIMDAIERIEIHVRTLLTYHLGHTFGAFGHIDKNNFHPKFDHVNWIKKLDDEVLRSRDEFIRHYKTKYTGFPTVPIWMLTEIMSLGSLSILYNGLKNTQKHEIANELNLHYKRLADWLHKLTYIRNLCAHHNRVWNRELAVRPENVKDPLWNPPRTPRNDRIFYILLILRHMLDAIDHNHDWVERCNALLLPISKNDSHRLSMGMPADWQTHPLWRSA